VERQEIERIAVAIFATTRNAVILQEVTTDVVYIARNIAHSRRWRYDWIGRAGIGFDRTEAVGLGRLLAEGRWRLGKEKRMKNVMLVASGSLFGVLALATLHARVVKKDVHPKKTIVHPTALTKEELFSQDHAIDVLAVESVFSAYTFYNDSHNGPGAASLFTENAVIHFVWNNHGTLVPEFGINPYQTPDGMNGEGCVLTGHQDIAQYFGYSRDVNNQPLAIPYTSHHMAVNKMVKVSDGGETAMLTATWMTTGGAEERAPLRE
jgi:hypothetical protein